MAFEKYKPRGLFSEFYGMLRGETSCIILRFWFLSTTTKHYPPSYTIDMPGSLYDGFLSQICWKGGKSKGIDRKASKTLWKWNRHLANLSILKSFILWLVSLKFSRAIEISGRWHWLDSLLEYNLLWWRAIQAWLWDRRLHDLVLGCCGVWQEVWVSDVSETLNLDNLLMKIKNNHYFTKNFLVTFGQL